MRLSGSVLLIMIVAVLLVGCGPTETPQPAPTTVPPSATPLPPTATNTASPVPPTDAPPQPTATLTSTATPHPISTMSALVSVASLNLRSGPSTMYQVQSAYPEDTAAIVLGKAPGDEWVFVEMPDGETGWMSVQLLDLDGDVAYLPVEEITDSQVISGRVIDSSAEPVNGVNVAVLKRLVDATLRTDAYSGEDGTFYAYIPLDSTGNWEAQIVGVRCDSRIVDDNCNIDGHIVYSSRILFEPTLFSPLVFMYEIATATINGTVADAGGQPVSMRIFADRSDGAYSYILSAASGEFLIPASDGVWDVYAIQYNPNVEGDHVTVQVVNGQQVGSVNLVAPE
ncbi:MAG: SH3 domain-containing protein [Anaerolineaceae bacterium]|nr:SH3 domain-containing protein [Anaerolineaceae bacterium]